METVKKPNLRIGERYTIKSHPQDEKLNSIYLGSGRLDNFGVTHVFVNRNGDIPIYVFADNHWLREIDGVLTYTPISSFLLEFINAEQIRRLPESTETDKRKSALIKLLNGLGEKL